MRTDEPRGTGMNEYGRLAELQINERVERASRARVAGRRREHGRQQLARRLHDLADCLEG